MKKILLPLIVSAIIAGCATKVEPTYQQMSKSLDENKAVATRFYAGKSKKEVLQASHKALYMLDPGYDISFDVSGNGVYAKRMWVVYLVVWSVIGIDQYNATAEDSAGGVKLTFAFSSDSLPLVGPANSFKKNLEVGHYENAADFKLFHDRVEYFLGLRKDWVTCEVAKRSQKDLSRDMFLCDSVGLENASPEDEIVKNFKFQ